MMQTFSLDLTQKNTKRLNFNGQRHDIYHFDPEKILISKM